MNNNESGFSLVELSIAVGLAIALSSITVGLMSGTIDKMSSKANAYADCGLKHEAAAKDLIEGIEPTISPSCTPAPTPSAAG